MTRRKPYTKVFKENQIREDHVKGMGDVLFKSFQCINPKCKEFLFVRKDELSDIFDIECPKCGYRIKSGEETRFYNYKLKHLTENRIIEEGEFSILHDDYVLESQEYKYCIICNSIKNQTRITDQHREAAQKRRLYLDFSGGEKKANEIYIETYGNHLLS